MEIISFKNVSKTYSDGRETIEALKETSFSINSG
ncbi:MAG: hemin ABC transporter ATP-binding protein, partial [Globicatella sulfidifaciens]|nr:hemin ABC transporter ATP-binding protein [Globicatella sulfidifaciens]